MASTINASLTAGLVTTADTTGNLNLQSGGATVVAVTSAGQAVTGTMSASGATTLSSTLAAGNTTITGTLSATSYVGVGTTTPTTWGAFAVRLGVSNYFGRIVSGAFSDATNSTLEIGHAANVVFLDTEGSALRVQSSGTVITTTSSTGLAVTGATVAAFKVNSTRADAVYCQDGDNNTAGQIDLKNTGSASGNFMVYRNSAGSVAGTISHSGSTTVAYNTSSDHRLKENVKPMENALEKILLLNPVTYTWIEDKTPGEGFIAHELQEISPNCVTGEKDGLDKDGNPLYQGIDVSFLVATLTSAIQELAAKVAKLEAA